MSNDVTFSRHPVTGNLFCDRCSVMVWNKDVHIEHRRRVNETIQSIAISLLKLNEAMAEMCSELRAARQLR